MASSEKIRIGVMTSGGDAPGMNAAIRAVVKSAIRGGAEVYGIFDGYMGLQHPEKGIVKISTDAGTVRLSSEKGIIELSPEQGTARLSSSFASGILSLGGTVLGTARCKEMMTAEGRRRAIKSLASLGIDRLVCIGGDGSLTGAETLRTEWQDSIKSLITDGLLPEDTLTKHPYLSVIGLPGTIDNDLCGSDITIGADTALHRIVDAVDDIFSTAASHQRTFVVEVMGRHCGYLAVMTGLATGAEWILIPEDPCRDGWENDMGEALAKGRAAGKRAGIVIVAEGARDVHGNAITAADVQKILSERMGEDARVTILGHVQRGGAPSAYDRNLSSILGYEAVKVAMQDRVDPSVVLGMCGNRPTSVPLMQAVEDTHKAQAACISEHGNGALALRSHSLALSYKLFRVVNSTKIHKTIEHPKRIAVFHCGAPAPGMNMAVRTVTRLAIAKGHEVVAIRGGFAGLVRPNFRPLDWMDVSGWAGMGGAEIGTGHVIPKGPELYMVARAIEDSKIDALIMIGGWSGYQAVYSLYRERTNYPTFNIPMICIPASIDNNLPGSEFSIGADTALNSIVSAVDKIKRSAVANKRVFLVEVMGYECGYLAQMSGLASGAERIYLHERPKEAADILADINELKEQFAHKGRTVALIINNERANPVYNTGVLRAMFEAESGGYYDVRQAILGHMQQGGDPTPFDRTLAARLSDAAVNKLMELFDEGSTACGFVGTEPSGSSFYGFHDYELMIDDKYRRPRKQWWLEFGKVNDDLV